jgi:hypothetical protein
MFSINVRKEKPRNYAPVRSVYVFLNFSYFSSLIGLVFIYYCSGAFKVYFVYMYIALGYGLDNREFES